MSARMRARVSTQREPLQHGVDAARLHPLRQQVLERIAAGGVRIGVAVDVEPARLGGRDHVERARRLAPVVRARALEVHDLDVHAAGLGDRDRLLDRFQDLARFVAQMREVAGIVPLDHVAERDHLVGLRVGARRGEQAGREPERAGRERLLEQCGHGRELVRRRRAVRHAHDHQAQRVVADQHAGVHGGRRKRVEIIGKRGLPKRQPRRAGAEIVAEELDLAGQRRRDREAAMADDLRGDPLAHLALGLGIDRQREVGMGLDVDEAGRDHEACRVDHLGGVAANVSPDGGDAAVADREIARLAGGAAAVEQQAAADENVVHADILPWRRRVGRGAPYRTFPQLLSEAHRPRSSRKRSIGADDRSARMR